MIRSLFVLPAPSGVAPVTVVADELLSDRDVIWVGGHGLRVLHTPGHSPGGICLYAGSALFCGDVLFRGKVGKTSIPHASPEDLARSLLSLLTLPGSVRLHPGHGFPSTLTREKQTILTYAKHGDRRNDRGDASSPAATAAGREYA